MSLWNYTIDDASPFLSYSPYSDGSAITNGWRTWYTESQYISAENQVSRGDSYHITALRNANASFQFFGTGVSLYGFTNSSFNVIIDDQPSVIMNSPASDSLLFSSQRLSNELHTVTLSALPSPDTNLAESLAFNFAIASTPLDKDESYPSPVFHDNRDTKSFVYSGKWTLKTQDGVPNGTVNAIFHQTTQVNASVSFSFSGANAVVVKGLSDSDNGPYSVSLDGQTNIFNGTSLGTIPDALLFFRAGLDPNTKHELNLVNLGSRLCLNSITVFEHELRDIGAPNLSPTHHSSSKSLGVIVGPVAGCVFFLAALGLLLLLWSRHRHRDGQRHLAMSGFKNKLMFPKPKRRSRTPRQPSAVISPMLATLSQEDRSVTSDVLSTYTSTSSDAYSSTHLLRGFSNYGHRSIQSVISSNAAQSQIVQDPFGNWEAQHACLPSIPSQAGSSSGHRSAYSQGSASRMSAGTTRRLTMQTSSSSITEFGSPLHSTQTPAPDYVRTPSRGPLPPLPIPSYDAALRDPQPTPDEVREMESLQSFGSSRYNRRLSTYTAITAVTAPPQYEI